MDVPDPIILSDHPASGGTAETGYDPESDVLLYHAVQTDRSGMPDARLYLIIAGFVAAGIALLVGVGAFLKTQDKFVLYI